MRKTVYDWETVEQYFFKKGHKNKVSLRNISEKFDIPYQSVRRYAAQHQWHKRRYGALCEGKHSE